MPYRHDYSQCLTYKIMLARKPDIVYGTFESALAMIRQISRMTGGLKQIVYLVGWQFDGHDSKYPSWDSVNTRLQRSHDVSAVDSLRWLMRESKQFNAVVSLHINMDDAYPNSPAWEEYVSKGLIVTKHDGTLAEAAVWDGEVSFQICKPREWDAGLAQRRINALVDWLPLKEAGTVHIDAMRPQSSMVHAGVSYERELETVKTIIAHWRDHGIDVTTEFLACHELIGEHPMVYHLNADEETRLKHPAAVICGGGDSWNQRRATLENAPAWTGAFSTPEAGCKYEEAWGRSIDHDLHSPADYPKFIEDFHLRTLPWLLMNRHRPTHYVHSATSYEVQYTDGLIAHVDTRTRHLTVRQGDQLYLDGTDVFLPTPWQRNRWVAYSQAGSSRSWCLPPTWPSDRPIAVRALWPNPERRLAITPNADRLNLELSPGEAVELVCEA